MAAVYGLLRLTNSGLSSPTVLRRARASGTGTMAILCGCVAVPIFWVDVHS